MKTTQNIVMAALLVFMGGCSIDFAMPAFPKDVVPEDSHSGDASADIGVPDGFLPDSTFPDLVNKVCQDLEGGICVGPADEFEKNSQGCPWGYEQVAVPGCDGESYCCFVSPSCVKAGKGFNVQDDGVGCCPELSSVEVCDLEEFDGCACSGEDYVCTACGDGTCETWENHCNCPQDCPLGGNECKDNGGFCQDVCPPMHEELPYGGCGEGMMCCAQGGECVGAGGVFEDAPGNPPCCEGLEPISETNWLGGTAETVCEEDPFNRVCTACGDSFCESWESWCTCPEDCEKEPENLCVMDGGQCMNTCPQNWTPVYLDGCGPQQCCMKNNEVCVQEGESLPPGSDAWCCENLVPIDVAWVTDDGGCDFEPNKICAACGDLHCNDEIENVCNCPQDCGAEPPDGCFPDLAGLPSGCSSDQFCQAPPHVCGMSGPIGQCVQIPDACPQDFDPVCTCQHNNFMNACLALKAGENIAWFGACEGEDGSECYGFDVEILMGVDEGGCCGDLQMELYQEMIGNACSSFEDMYVCVFCGDGFCGPGENACICPNDCDSWF